MGVAEGGAATRETSTYGYGQTSGGGGGFMSGGGGGGGFELNSVTPTAVQLDQRVNTGSVYGAFGDWPFGERIRGERFGVVPENLTLTAIGLGVVVLLAATWAIYRAVR